MNDAIEIFLIELKKMKKEIIEELKKEENSMQLIEYVEILFFEKFGV